jgi:hypothetical protein
LALRKVLIPLQLYSFYVPYFLETAIVLKSTERLLRWTPATDL